MGWKPHVVLGALIAVLAWLLWRDGSRRGPDHSPEPRHLRLLAGQTLQDVDRIELQPAAGDGVLLERDGAGRWWLVSPDHTRRRADPGRVAWLLDTLEFADCPPSLAPLAAAAPPWGAIRLGAPGQDLDLSVWLDGSGPDAAVEVAVTGGAPVRTDASALAALLRGGAEPWLEPRLLPLDPRRVVRLALDAEPASAELARERFQWWYVKPVRARTSSARVNDFLTRLSELEGTSAAPGESPAGTALPGSRTERRLLRALLWSEELAGAAELVLWQEAGGNSWVETDAGRRRIAVPPATAAEIAVDPLEFVPQTLVEIDAGALIRLGLEAGEVEWTLARAGPQTPWEIFHPYQAMAEPAAVEAFLEGLSRLRVQRLIGPAPESAAARPRGGRLKLTLRFERAAAWDAIDPAASGPELVIDLEMLSPDGWIGARSDEAILYQLSPDAPSALRVDPMDLRSHQVHLASQADFRSVEVKSERRRETWRRGEPEPAWLAALLAALSDLRAARYLSRDLAEAAGYGLRPAPLEIDWRLARNGDEVPHRLQLAARRDGRVMAMLDESGWVFEADPGFQAAVEPLLPEPSSLGPPQLEPGPAGPGGA